MNILCPSGCAPSWFWVSSLNATLQLIKTDFVSTHAKI